MNIASTVRCLVCCLILATQISMAQGKDIPASGSGGNTAAAQNAITTPNDTPLVPEPSAGSLILLSLGGIVLAMKLRKTALHTPALVRSR